MTPVPYSRYWCFGVLASSALAWDLISKSWIFTTLGYPYRKSAWEWGCDLLWGRFHIQLFTTFNKGALFGLGQGWGWLFALLSIAATVGIFYWLFVRGEARSWWMTVTLALILGGALGNLYDRLYLHGCTSFDGNAERAEIGVRDFIKCDIPGIAFERPFRFRLIPVYEWPVFNFADTYLVTGAIMLTLYSLFVPQPAPNAPGVAAAPVKHDAAPQVDRCAVGV